MAKFCLQAPFKPTGDQPGAIAQLTVIEKAGRPTLVLAHNKTLAAQLCNELRDFFPDNSVEYFISYYDYYQPEAYLPVDLVLVPASH